MVRAMRHTMCTLLLAAVMVPVTAAELSTLATAAAQGPIQARAFIGAITTPAAKQVFAAAGWEF